MHAPPFKLSALSAMSGAAAELLADCECGEVAETRPASARVRLAELSTLLHCSVVGTCLGTADLRKLMSRFIDVRGVSDHDIHHDAVRMAGSNATVAKALHKALDQRHDAATRRFSRVRGVTALALLWDEALAQGEIPGAYWALLTHRDASTELRNRAFGDVHMLSHLVGASNRADIRRLVALERDNAEIRSRSEQQLERAHELVAERDRRIERLERELVEARAQRAMTLAGEGARAACDTTASADAEAAWQRERREDAERAAARAEAEVGRLRGELESVSRQMTATTRELMAAETQLQEAANGAAPSDAPTPRLRGKRLLYVGGRPGSMPAIRAMVLRHGGEFQHHDGGLEDRKGLLGSGVAWADLVLFPVDCVDHDSAGNLKRLCQHRGVAFVPLRGASVACFAAALAGAEAN